MGWPELDWVAKKHKELVFARLKASGARSVSPIDVPKENFMIRPAVVIDPVDRLAYQALTDRLSKSVIGEMHRQAYGWRLHVKDPKPGAYSTNDAQWELYRNHLSALVANFEVALKTDVVSCFASLRLDVIADEFYARAGSSAVVERTLSMLESWEKAPNRSGIPQRSLASAVLGNMVLSRIDDILKYHAKPMSPAEAGLSFARWMDDIWLFGSDAGDLRSAQIEIQDGLQALGLHINTGKTKLLEGSEIADHALNVAHSAVDDGFLSLIAGKPADTGPLDELVEKLLAEKEEASRTSIKFATKRMREHKHFSKVDGFVDVAPRMPHAADALARLFRDADRANELASWYLEYRSTPWAKLQWSSAQLGTMFSSSVRPQVEVVDHFAEILSAGGLSLPMAALAAQRLASWDASKARAVISEAVKKSDSALQRRVLALAALHADHNRTIIKKWLNDFEENSLTLEMLKETNFKKPKLKPDFEG
ncbi:RNA-directed DNA polymerase [Phytohabitans houttuyneae]|uniref:Reverse transcriptase domain-containing protein n=1 Tax=Phytohabitans houttuyneae TaxID=1076126 RepID=A0A6V8K2P1_9ACTN|nr:RNA-directed DNA polymerase [Phytohabitans houttuyneae]GFJ77770.1 hypothetical protein Phou_019500 [Phytohabitans houttuyneae]